MKRFFLSKILTLSLPIAILTSFALQYPSAAQYQAGKQATRKLTFVPPRVPINSGRVSGRRAGLGSRNNCPAVENQLTALVPESQLETSSTQNAPGAVSVGGLTASERPTFLFYLPYTKNSASVKTEFVLEDNQGKNIYRKQVPLPAKPSIVDVALPNSIPALEVGKTYHWYLKVRCNQQATANPPVYVEGYIKRIDLNRNVEQELLAARNPQEKISIYADNGVWFDSLNILAQQRQKNPNDTSLASDWQNLLQAVKLENFASVPFAN